MSRFCENRSECMQVAWRWAVVVIYDCKRDGGGSLSIKPCQSLLEAAGHCVGVLTEGATAPGRQDEL